jgi:hypothetical protein
MRRLIALLLLLTVPAFASSTRTVDADAIISADHSKTYNLPASGDTLAGRASTDTFQNKSIAGDQNTLTKVPIAGDQIQETPSGSVNGSNVTFTLSNTPGSTSSLKVYIDGVQLIQGTGKEYTISGATITTTTAPGFGQAVQAVYSKY